jgi:hypothetical protein
VACGTDQALTAFEAWSGSVSHTLHNKQAQRDRRA